MLAVLEVTLEALPDTHIARRRNLGRKKSRKMSCFALGILAITVALLQGLPAPTGCFIPFQWPVSPPPEVEDGVDLPNPQKTVEAKVLLQV